LGALLLLPLLLLLLPLLLESDYQKAALQLTVC
jgi:hypothetical protein